MDLHDKQFDNWVQDQINAEIPLSRAHKQTAWEQIRLATVHSAADLPLELEKDFARITAPLVAHEPLPTRIVRWLDYVLTHESSYHKAHANSFQYFKSDPQLTGGLTLYGLEFMRQRWTWAV